MKLAAASLEMQRTVGDFVCYCADIYTYTDSMLVRRRTGSGASHFLQENVGSVLQVFVGNA